MKKWGLKVASITERKTKNGVSYLIRVFVDQKASGKQVVKSMTFKPDLEMGKKEIKKSLKEAVDKFEKQIKDGLVEYDGRVKFADYAAQWMEGAKIAPKTREFYELCLKRINEAIGHVKLKDIRPRHLDSFYKNLGEDGISDRGRFAVSDKLRGMIKDMPITHEKLSQLSGVSTATISAAQNQRRVSIESAKKIAAALDVPVRDLFTLHMKTTGLSDKTILHHHRVISIILGEAKRECIIPYNVAKEHIKAPTVIDKEARYLDDDEARRLVGLLLHEDDIRIKTAILLALSSGVRRGELCGLSWDDIDKKKQVIHVKKASQYQQKNGIVEVSPKTKSSKRAIKLPLFVFEVLSEYQRWWLQQKLLSGSKWQGDENRLFIQADGKPIFPDTINYWLQKFIEKHGLEHFTPHSLRHTFSTLQIMAGVNLKTLQARTGHSQVSTLTDIYAHTIRTAEEAATDILEDILLPRQGVM